VTILSTTISKEYTGNNSASTFDYPFKIFSQGDLEVTRVNADGSLTLLTINTDYKIHGNNNDATLNGTNDDAGGTVVYPEDPTDSSQTLLLTGEKLLLKRKMSFLQPLDLHNQGAFYAEVVEDSFDRVVMYALQAGSELDALQPATSAEILTGLKTVDGAGSGLDADTIDSVQPEDLTMNGGYF